MDGGPRTRVAWSSLVGGSALDSAGDAKEVARRDLPWEPDVSSSLLIDGCISQMMKNGLEGGLGRDILLVRKDQR